MSDARTLVVGSVQFCDEPGSPITLDLPLTALIPADYIVDTLKRFRSGEKESTVMVRIAKGFNDEEIEMLADYFSSRK